ncbi:MAG: acyl-CoA/acyl-ACP dehydrogenase, partial [Planctomycetaceae bacterium]|nr:acyl-CoA/acyl-ACP dehydrogenase [Planctomycetaceae bacterium]
MSAPLPLLNSDWTPLLDQLRAAAPQLATVDDWPTEQFQRLGEAGVLRWDIPDEFGGVDAASAQILAGYIDLAAACLVTTFVLTQRNAATSRIVASENEELRSMLLPPLAAGEAFATVGISHLTTSRQHLTRPAVAVKHDGGDFVLSGEIPWVTGGMHADYIVTGGVTESGQQVLLAVPRETAGVECRAPVELMSLSASGTGSIGLDGVRVPAKLVVAGPVERVMQGKSGGGTGSLGTSALAVGLTQRAVELIGGEAERRPDLEPIHETLSTDLANLRRDLLASAATAEPEGDDCSPESIRRRANSLVLRATQAALAASKGAGFVSGHPAERAVREAMFFLVWSCPAPVVAAALKE